jgi:hypothetical protein
MILSISVPDRHDCLWCVARISWAVLRCAPEVETEIGFITCVVQLIGAGHKCLPCVCYVADYCGLNLKWCKKSYPGYFLNKRQNIL